MVGLEKIIKLALQEEKAKYWSYYYTSGLHSLEITRRTNERAPATAIARVSSAPFQLWVMGLLGDGLGLHTISSAVLHSVLPTVSLGGGDREMPR